jgi:hypothetical protein
MDYVRLNTGLLIVILGYLLVTFERLAHLLSEAYADFQREVKLIRESLQRIELKLK